MHHHEYKDKVFVLELAESIKKRLVNRLDIFDSVLMGFLAKLKHEVVMEWVINPYIYS